MFIFYIVLTCSVYRSLILSMVFAFSIASKKIKVIYNLCKIVLKSIGKVAESFSKVKVVNKLYYMCS